MSGASGGWWRRRRPRVRVGFGRAEPEAKAVARPGRVRRNRDRAVRARVQRAPVEYVSLTFREKGDLLDEKCDRVGFAGKPQMVVFKEGSAYAARFVIEGEGIYLGFDDFPSIHTIDGISLMQEEGGGNET